MDAKPKAPLADPLTWSDEITPYDEEHLVTYLRLLDAEAAGTPDRDVCRAILDLDVDQHPEKTRRILADHMRRAKWMMEFGYKALLRQDA